MSHNSIWSVTGLEFHESEGVQLTPSSPPTKECSWYKTNVCYLDFASCK